MDRRFTLAADGDPMEQYYWARFIARRFPRYEKFWAAAVVPVTRREIDGDIRFRSDPELAAAGKTHEDVAIAQIHYTLMVHLGRAHDLTAELLDRWTYAEVFVRLTGASDCADELLERVANRGVYAAWSESDGRKARNRWRDVHGRPLRDIHDYRNRLVHGRVVPDLVGPGAQPGDRIFIYPRLDRVDDYLDWRRAFASPDTVFLSGDFDAAQHIARDAWERVVAYCDEAWAKHLVASESDATV